MKQQVLPEIRLGRPNPHRPKGETLMGDPTTVQGGMNRILGTRIALARIDLGKGLEEMADYTEYADTSIEFVEEGGYGPKNPLKLALIADFLGVTHEFFVQPVLPSEHTANQLILSPEQREDLQNQMTALAEKLEKQIQLLPTVELRYEYRNKRPAVNGLVYPPDPRQQNIFPDEVMEALTVPVEGPPVVTPEAASQPAIGGVREQIASLRHKRDALWTQIMAVDAEIFRLMGAAEE